jgi:hypothetical protein
MDMDFKFKRRTSNIERPTPNLGLRSRFAPTIQLKWIKALHDSAAGASPWFG